jgi:hypothetical protein
MMNKREILSGRLLSFWAATMFLLVFACWQPSYVQAQWTSPDANGNINTTASGNVGIGTSSPGYPLHISRGGTGELWLLAVFDNTAKTWSSTVRDGIYFEGRYSGQSTNWSVANINYGFTDTYANGGSTLSFDLVNTSGGWGKVMTLKGKGNVGIGTSNPTYRLQIAGNNTQDNYPIIKLQNTQTGGHSWWLYAGALGNAGAFGIYDETASQYRLFFDENGNVGIGNKTILSFPLDVAGRINGSELCINGNCKSSWADVSGSSQWTTGTGNIYYNTGNVGIGTTSPNSNLDIASSTARLWVGTSSATNADANASPRMYLGGTAGVTPGLFTFASNDTTNGDSLGSLQWANYAIGGTEKRVASIAALLDGASNSGALVFNTWNAGTYGEAMRINKTGNVGIGTPTPGAAYKLDVVGQIRSTGGFCIGEICKNTWAEISGSSQWTTNTGNIYYSTGNVGIGTQTPFQKLQVEGAIGATGVITSGNTGTGAYLYDDGTNANLAAYTGTNTRTLNVSGQSIVFKTGASSYAEKMRIDDTGNVNIGNASSPQVTVDVQGSLNATGAITGGTINAKYQDVAEWVQSNQKLTAGTVVILDPERTNQVIASMESYDTRVAGVISDSPGVILGEGGAGKVKVATTGRVKVRVDATRGEIRVGDLLVTSDEEGVAMKSEAVMVSGIKMHRPGTLIGKALEPLKSGKGEILVLLSLQ